MMPSTKVDLELTRSAVNFLRERMVGLRLLAVLVAVGLMVLAGWLSNMPAVYLGRIVDSVIEGDTKSFSGVVPFLFVISALILGREIATWLRRYLVENVATAIERDEFVKIIGKILRLDLSILVGERIGALNVRVNRSIEGVTRLIKLVFLDFLPTVTVAVVAIYLATSRHWAMFVVMVSVVVIGAGITFWQIKSQEGIRVDLFRAKEDIGAWVTELLFGIDYVRASGAVSAEVCKGNQLAIYLREKEFRHHKWMMSFDSLKQLVEGTGLVSVIAVGAWLASQGSVSEGDVLTFAVLFGSVAAPLRELHRIVDEGFEALLRIADLFRLNDLPCDEGLSGQGKPIASSAAAIEAANVTVEYRDADGRTTKAVRELSFVISPHEVIGIAGPSGSGKSTLARLILGLISGYSGSIKVLGVEVRNVDKEILSELIAYVPQVPFLIRGSVRDNVLYGINGNDISDEEIWQALDRARLREVVMAMPGMLEGEVAEHGRNLSGGERQRLVLARMFLKGAQFIVLDEATAALDAVNEKFVQTAIEAITPGKTVIIIAHRLRTLRSADRILVFKDGVVVADGNFEVLSRTSKLFSRLNQETEGERA